MELWNDGLSACLCCVWHANRWVNSAHMFMHNARHKMCQDRQINNTTWTRAAAISVRTSEYILPCEHWAMNWIPAVSCKWIVIVFIVRMCSVRMVWENPFRYWRGLRSEQGQKALGGSARGSRWKKWRWETGTPRGMCNYISACRSYPRGCPMANERRDREVLLRIGSTRIAPVFERLIFNRAEISFLRKKFWAPDIVLKYFKRRLSQADVIASVCYCTAF